VLVNYREQAKDAEEVVFIIEKAGGEAFPFQADVGVRGAVNEMVAEAVKRFGGVGYLGTINGEVYLGNQKLPIEVPRVRDQRERKEVPLRSYERLQEPRNGDEGELEADSSWVEL
jgi:NAD(P)-dependent dehydrogenase (short-subunit alcohol dehydrogenase family)